MNPSTDLYFDKVQKWREELEALRAIILDCGLEEELKWSVPIYTHKGKNIVGLNGLKNFCVISFFKGALLQNEEGVLEEIGKVQSARWIKFTAVKQIVKIEPVLKAYIFEAIEVEKAGLKVVKKKLSEYPIPKEFQNRLDEMPSLKKAFKALTPGRQKAYIVYFSQAKLSKTRKARVEKCLKQILNGRGLLY